MIVTTTTMTCDLCGRELRPEEGHMTMRVEYHGVTDLVYRPNGDGSRTYVACVGCQRFMEIGLSQLASLRTAVWRKEAEAYGMGQGQAVHPS